MNSISILPKNRLATLALHLALNRKSRILPSESTARYRYFHAPQKNSKKKTLDEGWYILTNLDSLAALNAYKARSGIEAMFKDCKSGGYNARGVQSIPRTIKSDSFTDSYCLYLCGIGRIKNQATGATEICRSSQRTAKNCAATQQFLGRAVWIVDMEFCRDLVQKLMIIRLNKLPFYKRGLSAMNLIQQAF